MVIILDSLYLQEYLKATLETDEIEVPPDVDLPYLTELFVEYLEVDIYEWLRDNYNAFFRDIDWDTIRDSRRNGNDDAES